MTTEEEKQFGRFSASFPWLELVAAEDRFYLGCSVCKASRGGRGSTFGAGRYEVGKYFYKRTLDQHSMAPCHRQGQEAVAPERPEVAQVESPVRSAAASSVGSPSQGSPASSGDTVLQCATRHVIAAYNTMLMGASAVMFASFMLVSRLQGVQLLGGHDDENFFTRARGCISLASKNVLKQDINNNFK